MPTAGEVLILLNAKDNASVAIRSVTGQLGSLGGAGKVVQGSLGGLGSASKTAQGAIGGLGSAGKGAQTALGGLGGAVRALIPGLAAFGSVVGVIAFLKNIITEASAAQEVETQLDAALASTGKVAEEQARKWAEAQGKTVTSLVQTKAAIPEAEVAQLRDRLERLTASLNDQQAAWNRSKTYTESAALRMRETREEIAKLQGQLANTGATFTSVTTSMATAMGLMPPVARMTKDELVSLAESLAMVTRADDEAVMGAEAMLLTFTQIGKNVFPDTIKAVLDMATAMNSGGKLSLEQLRSTAMQVGKALQDPAQGMQALRRVGVAFTDDQEDLIKGLVAVGKVEEAQRFILKELQTEFGGSAEAAGKTFPGQLDILKNTFGMLKEEIGLAVLPALTSLAQRAIPVVVAAIPKVQKAMADLVAGAKAAGEWIGERFRRAGRTAGDVLFRLRDGIIAQRPVLGGLIGLTGGVLKGMIPLNMAWKEAGKLLGPVRERLRGVGDVIGQLGGAFRGVTIDPVALAKALETAGLSPTIATAAATIASNIVGWIQGAWASVSATYADKGLLGVAQLIGDELVAVFTDIEGRWSEIDTGIAGWWTTFGVKMGEGAVNFSMGYVDVGARIRAWAESPAIADSAQAAGEVVGRGIGVAIVAGVKGLLRLSMAQDEMGGGLLKAMTRATVNAMKGWLDVLRGLLVVEFNVLKGLIRSLLDTLGEAMGLPPGAFTELFAQIEDAGGLIGERLKQRFDEAIGPAKQALEEYGTMWSPLIEKAGETLGRKVGPGVATGITNQGTGEATTAWEGFLTQLFGGADLAERVRASTASAVQDAQGALGGLLIEAPLKIEIAAAMQANNEVIAGQAALVRQALEKAVSDLSVTGEINLIERMRLRGLIEQAVTGVPITGEISNQERDLLRGVIERAMADVALTGEMSTGELDRLRDLLEGVGENVPITWAPSTPGGPTDALPPVPGAGGPTDALPPVPGAGGPTDALPPVPGAGGPPKGGTPWLPQTGARAQALEVVTPVIRPDVQIPQVRAEVPTIRPEVEVPTIRPEVEVPTIRPEVILPRTGLRDMADSIRQAMERLWPRGATATGPAEPTSVPRVHTETAQPSRAGVRDLLGELRGAIGRPATPVSPAMVAMSRQTNLSVVGLRATSGQRLSDVSRSWGLFRAMTDLVDSLQGNVGRMVGELTASRRIQQADLGRALTVTGSVPQRERASAGKAQVIHHWHLTVNADGATARQVEGSVVNALRKLGINEMAVVP